MVKVEHWNACAPLPLGQREYCYSMSTMFIINKDIKAFFLMTCLTVCCYHNSCVILVVQVYPVHPTCLAINPLKHGADSYVGHHIIKNLQYI